MRVIHEDGRTGTVLHCMPQGRFAGFTSDELGCEQVVETAQLRRLGPIEDELRRCDADVPFATMSRNVVFDGVWEASDQLFGEELPRCAVTWRAECLSEAIEACERIYQQTGEVL